MIETNLLKYVGVYCDDTGRYNLANGEEIGLMSFTFVYGSKAELMKYNNVEPYVKDFPDGSYIFMIKINGGEYQREFFSDEAAAVANKSYFFNSKVRLFVQNYNNDLDPKEVVPAKVLKFMKKNTGTLTVTYVQRCLGMNMALLNCVLKFLFEKGLIQKEGDLVAFKKAELPDKLIIS